MIYEHLLYCTAKIETDEIQNNELDLYRDQSEISVSELVRYCSTLIDEADSFQRTKQMIMTEQNKQY